MAYNYTFIVGMLLGFGLIFHFASQAPPPKKKNVDIDEMVPDEFDNRKSFEKKKEAATFKKFKKYSDMLETDTPIKDIIISINKIEDHKYK